MAERLFKLRAAFRLQRKPSLNSSTLNFAQQNISKAEALLGEVKSLRATLDAISAAGLEEEPDVNNANSFCGRIASTFRSIAEQYTSLNNDTDTMLEHYEGQDLLYGVLGKLMALVEELDEGVKASGKVMTELGLPVRGIVLPAESAL